MFRIGKIYESKEDYEKALKRYKEFDDYHKCQMAIGLLYKLGKGVEQDNEEAIKWFRKASEKGNKESQFYLGETLLEQGTFWIQRSAEKGHEEAKRSFQNIIKINKPFIPS
jgi:TPR repeat protein